MNKLEFYKQPFYNDEGWVYDADDNFVFQFENTNYLKQENVVKQLNITDVSEMKSSEINLIYSERTAEIYLQGELFITIRGWGNLTGVGGFNMNHETATKVQNDFAYWIINQLKYIKCY